MGPNHTITVDSEDEEGGDFQDACESSPATFEPVEGASHRSEEYNNEDETDEEYRLRVYRTTDMQGSMRRLSRSMSRRFSQELGRRRSSIEEALPKTPSGWAILLSSVGAAVTLYESYLQYSLACPPMIYGQYNEEVLRPIYAYLTRSKDSILSRRILPSLFVGTRSVVASSAAYYVGGPPISKEYVRFRQLLTMSQDGATVALDWELPKPDELYDAGTTEERKNAVLNGPITQPVVLILHGINNDATFGYIRSAMRACTKRGWIAVGMNFRTCGGTPMTTPRGYTGAYTGDIRCVVQHISARMAQDATLFLVGNSLGANLVTKYLGEEGLAGTLPSCVAGGVSLGNPLHIHSGHIGFPWGQVLSLGARKDVLKSLRHLKHMRSSQFQSAIRKTLLSNTIGEFDKAMAPIFIRNDPYFPFSMKIGYNSGEEYWADASSFRFVPHVTVPLLQLTSQDDFLVYRGSLGKLNYALSNPNVMVVKTKCGGHLGWQEAPPDTNNIFGFGTSWADTAMGDFIEAILKTKQQGTTPMMEAGDSAHHGQNEKPGVGESAPKMRSRL